MLLGLVQADPLQMRQCGVDLAEVGPRAGDDDAQLDGCVGIQLVCLGGPGQFDGPLRMLQRPFAVGHDREMPWATAHPTGSAQLSDRFRPLTCPVGDESDGFPDDPDSPAASPRRPGMPPSGFGLVIGERAGRDQVRGDPIGALLAQPAEVATYLHVERFGGRPFRQIGPGLTDVFFAAA